MAGLVPAIQRRRIGKHAFIGAARDQCGLRVWMAGTSPAMTVETL
jgi:hypothetical protein